MITADVKAYTHFFEAGIKSVRITKLERWKDDRDGAAQSRTETPEATSFLAESIGVEH